jgi:hypothetical protein
MKAKYSQKMAPNAGSSIQANLDFTHERDVAVTSIISAV